MQKSLFVALLGVLFIAQMACQKKSVTTPNGNTVTVHTSNSGPKAQMGQTVSVNVNTFVKDSMVQSTRRDFGGPRDLPLPKQEEIRGKMPAVFEAILMMAKGDSATLIQPADSAMLDMLQKRFGPDAKEIRYEIVLVDILTEEAIKAREAEERQKMEAAQKEQEAEQKEMEERMKNAPAVKALEPKISSLVAQHLADYKAGKLGDKLQKTASGLELVVLEKGNGAPVKDGDKVWTNYYGVLKSTGKMFDNSYSRGHALPFPVGGLVPGFNEGMKMLNHGGKAVLFIPSALGYGDQGAGADIPPGSDLVFYLEME